jgi:Cu-processing system permease protein
MYKISKYVILDILRNKFVLGYGFFIFLVTFALLNLEGESSKSMVSILNIVLLVLPLIAIVFATIHFYNSYEFIEMMLSQPVKRSWILMSEYLGVCISFSLAYTVGMGIPLLLYGQTGIMGDLLVAGILLTFVFVSLASLSSVVAKDKARGIGVSLLLWFFFTVIYDGIILILLFTFNDYPVEKLMLLVTSLNPIDLVRVSILTKMDSAAMMGYTGAVFKEMMDGFTGTLFSVAVLSAWIILPMVLAVRIFNKKDI